MTVSASGATSRCARSRSGTSSANIGRSRFAIRRVGCDIAAATGGFYQPLTLAAQSVACLEREAVGHAGYVIGDDARGAGAVGGSGGGLRARSVLVGHVAVIGRELGEQKLHGLPRLIGHASDVRVRIQRITEKPLQRALRVLQRLAELNETTRQPTHLVDVTRFGRGDRRSARAREIAN